MARRLRWAALEGWARNNPFRAAVLGSLVVVLIVALVGVGWHSLNDNGSKNTPQPQATSRPNDQDGDGVPDSRDMCPEKRGDIPDGCPRDADGDGVPDKDDRCPTQPARTSDGCPPPPATVRCARGSQPAQAFEPNNSATEAYGPLRSGKRYQATIESSDDQDWFAFCTDRQGLVTVSVTLIDDNDECLDFEATVGDHDAAPLRGDRPSLYGFDTIHHPNRDFSFQARRDMRYYLDLDAGNFECQGGIYAFTVTGPLVSRLGRSAGPPL